ncbi:L-type lectin-domain containing receptor kinase V.7 [Linum perenne]
MDMNDRLGDFGLAGSAPKTTKPQTTHVVGTVTYLALELSRLGKETSATDIYSFKVFMLEEMILVDWVIDLWKRGDVYLGSERSKIGRGLCEGRDGDGDEIAASVFS